MIDPPVDNWIECGSCGGRGYVPDEPETLRPDGTYPGRTCGDCCGEGWIPWRLKTATEERTDGCGE